MLENPPRAEAEAFITAHLEFITRLRGPAREGWVFSGQEAFLLAHGRFFEPDLVAFPPMVAKQCFDNAYRVARRKAAKDRYHYVEGYAFRYIPVAHAWLVDAQGRVLDPTWPDGGAAYFGVELDLTEVRRSREAGWNSLLDDYLRRFPAARGVPVIAKNAWFRRRETAGRDDSSLPDGDPHGICSP